MPATAGLLVSQVGTRSRPRFAVLTKFFQKLECTIRNAFLEVNEFALYSVLETLLGMYADSFTILEGLDSQAFIHVARSVLIWSVPQHCSTSDPLALGKLSVKILSGCEPLPTLRELQKAEQARVVDDASTRLCP